MHKIIISSPGKLFLFGEHAVMYGEPCIVTAIDKRLQVIVEKTTEKILINSPQSKDTRFIDAALGKFGISYGATITTQSDFSNKYGFGSSAAITVALVKALTGFLGHALTPQELFEQSFEIVTKVQGTGSGADVAAVVFGGTIFYQKEDATIESVRSDWGNFSLVVGYSGIKANTVELISELEQKQRGEPEKFRCITSAIGKVVQNAKLALEQQDFERVGKYMDVNQEYLRDLGVSTQKLEDLILAAKKGGALGAKISGAGGGDSIIALVTKSNRAQVENAIVTAGGEVVNVGINGEGARVE